MSKWKKNQIIGSLAATNFAPVFSFKSKFHFLIKNKVIQIFEIPHPSITKIRLKITCSPGI